MPKNRTTILEPGTKIFRLTVVKFSHQDKRWRRFYVWKCECGKEVTLQVSAVTTGNTKSCGCYGIEARKNKRISEHHSEITAIILGYKRHGERRGFKFLLSREFVSTLVLKDCEYCGSPPSNFMKTKNSIVGLPFNGIDRVDSSKDYTEDNVVPCCKICNNAKSDYTKEEFFSWINRLTEFQNKKKVS